MAGPDEFDVIDRLFRPLAAGAPEALNLMDDAAVIVGRPGYDLVVTKDALVEGVHFLSDDPMDLIARKLLRVNLSDLAAKGAVPYGYVLACAWPAERDWADRQAFAAGLAEDQSQYAIKLFGGDTVSTPGPMVFSATFFGWVESGKMVPRSGAMPGDLVQVSGPIGDGWLGLQAAMGGLEILTEPARAHLAKRYRLPTPRVDLSLTAASAAADVSDGLIADAGHIAQASGVAVEIELSSVPLSVEAQAWLAHQPDRTAALAQLTTGGDDYQIVATAPALLTGFTVIGRVTAGQGVRVLHDGEPITLVRSGYRHGNEA